MKNRLIVLAPWLAASATAARACELCESQQPKVLRGLVHGAGPQGGTDYLIVIAGLAVVLFALIFALKCLLRPGEREPQHIKRIILNQSHHGT